MESYYDEVADTEKTTKTGLTMMIFLQIVPIILVSIFFTSLIGYSRIMKEKGDVLSHLFKDRLEHTFSHINEDSSFDDVVALLQQVKTDNIKHTKFLVDSQGNTYTLDNTILSTFFLEYMNEFSDNNNGRVYEYYGSDTQGTVIRIKNAEGNWVVGIKYDISSENVIIYFFISFIILFGLNILVITYFSRTLADGISAVSKNLYDIAESVDVNLNKKLSVISNDEIGDLVLAFNKIQQREKENIESIKENQAILIEQERLASLGQLIGGIAHNIRTPIMSLSGAIEALKDLAYEYRDSIDDKSVTEQDHKEIAKEMLTWLEKMRPYCAYMSDVISAVKGQAVQMNASTMVKFTVDELIKRVDLLMRHELKKHHIILTVESQIDMNTEIKGEVSNLIQVFDNIIINAVHAYEGKEGTIQLKILRSGDNIEFVIEDKAKGIPKEITDRLFKEMVTTKGKNGTGLGLYMSYSTVKGRFGGNMSFNSVQGGGTTFYISIPSISYNQKEVS